MAADSRYHRQGGPAEQGYDGWIVFYYRVRVLLPRPACQRRWQCRARPSPQKDPETYHWATDLLGIPVIDHWWQTESGWPIDANPTGNELLPLQAGSRTRPRPVWDVRILTPGGTPAPAGQDGSIVVKLPMPPGALLTLWNDDTRFVRSCVSVFDGYYLTGDGGYIDTELLRRTMASIADGKNPVVPSTIDDPSVLDALRLVLHREPGIERFGRDARVPTGRPYEDHSGHASSHATSQGTQSFQEMRR